MSRLIWICSVCPLVFDFFRHYTVHIETFQNASNTSTLPLFGACSEKHVSVGVSESVRWATAKENKGSHSVFISNAMEVN